MGKDNTDKSTDVRLKNLKPPWKKGDPSPNPKGRKLGQRNYMTLYRLALVKIAKMRGMKPEALEVELISSGVARAGSDYRFYKDMLDRLHGMPVQSVNLGGEVEITNIFDDDRMRKIATELLKKNEK